MPLDPRLSVSFTDGGSGFRTVQVNAAEIVGAIRSLQGVNCGPCSPRPGLGDLSRQYRDLRIDLVRTHDLFGPVDIDAKWTNPDRIARFVKADASKCVFPDWSAAFSAAARPRAPSPRLWRAASPAAQTHQATCWRSRAFPGATASSVLSDTASRRPRIGLKPNLSAMVRQRRSAADCRRLGWS